MAYTNQAQQNFASGELSPKVRGRFDLKIFQNGAERMENFIAETQGPARFRTGLRFVNHTRLNQIAFLLEFQFNDEQSYILEFTALKLRIHKDNANILETAQVITGATQANPVVITIAGHPFSNGDEVFISGVVGMTELNSKFFLVANAGANTFELTDVDGNNIDSTGFTAYSSAGTAARVYEVTSPYAEADLFQLKDSQNADVAYFMHPTYDIRKLTRVTDTNWTFVTFARTANPFTGVDDYPSAGAFYEGRFCYGRTNNNPERFWLSRAPDSSGVPRYDDFTTGTDADHAVISTLSPVQGKVDSIQWLAGNVRSLLAGTFGGITKIFGGRNDEPISPAAIQIKTLNAFGCQNIMPIPLGSILLYVQRGGKIVRSLEYDILQEDLTAIDRTLVADHLVEPGIVQVDFQSGQPDMLWSVRDDGLLLGLTFKAKEDVSGWHRHIIGGTDVKVLSVASDPRASDFDRIWVVVERTINSLTRRYIEYFEDSPVIPEFLDFYTGDANEAADKATFGNAMFEKQKEYVHVDSALSYDGTDLGSDASATMTPGAVTGTGITFTASVAVFAAGDVGREIWKKAIDGVGTGRAVITAFVSTTEVTCRIEVDFDNVTAMAAGNWYLTALTISGLDHLEGEEVSIVTDGGVHPKKTVASGAITLDFQASKVHIGLGYTGLIKTMNVEQGGLNGPAQTKPRNVDKVGVRFLNTLGARFGTDRYKLEAMEFRSTAHKTDRPPPLFSGTKMVNFEDSWDRDKNIYIEQQQPLPCVVQMLDIFMDTTNE